MPPLRGAAPSPPRRPPHLRAGRDAIAAPSRCPLPSASPPRGGPPRSAPTRLLRRRGGAPRQGRASRAGSSIPGPVALLSRPGCCRPPCCHRQAAAGHPTVAARPHPSPARSAQRPRHLVASQGVPPQGVPDGRGVQPPDHAGQGQAGEVDAGGQRVREEHPERGGTSSGMFLEKKQLEKSCMPIAVCCIFTMSDNQKPHHSPRKIVVLREQIICDSMAHFVTWISKRQVISMALWYGSSFVFWYSDGPEGHLETTSGSTDDMKPTLIWSCVYIQEVTQVNFLLSISSLVNKLKHSLSCLALPGNIWFLIVMLMPDEYLDYRNILESIKKGYCILGCCCLFMYLHRLIVKPSVVGIFLSVPLGPSAPDEQITNSRRCHCVRDGVIKGEKRLPAELWSCWVVSHLPRG